MRRVKPTEAQFLGVRKSASDSVGDHERDPVDPEAPRDERDRLPPTPRRAGARRRRSPGVGVSFRRRSEEVEHAGVDRVAIHGSVRRAESRARTRAPPPARRAGARAGPAAARTAAPGPRTRSPSAISRTRAARSEGRGLSPRRRRAAPSFPLPPRRGRRSTALPPWRAVVSARSILARSLSRPISGRAGSAPAGSRRAQGARRALEVAERQGVLEPTSEELARGLPQARHEGAVVVEEGRDRSDAMARLEQSHRIREQLQPRLEVLARRLEMALDAVRDPPDPDRLVLIARRPGKADRPRRQGEVVGMPLADVQVRAGSRGTPGRDGLPPSGRPD